MNVIFGEVKFLLNWRLCQPQEAEVDVQDGTGLGPENKPSSLGRCRWRTNPEVSNEARGRVSGQLQRLDGKSKSLKGAGPRTEEGAKKTVGLLPQDCNLLCSSCGPSGWYRFWVQLSKSVFPKLYSGELRKVLYSERSCKKYCTMWSHLRKMWPACFSLLKALTSPAAK